MGSKESKKIDCTLEIEEITNNDGLTISRAVVIHKGKDIEIPITVLYNGPPELTKD